WQGCQPRPRLLHYYRAADVVLDQFSDTVGSFGTATAEALAVGKPVITYYNHLTHAWCEDVLPDHPPIWSARLTDQIYDALVSLAERSARRAGIGQASRQWIEHWHSLGRIARLHLELYERVLAAHRAQRQECAQAMQTIVETDAGAVGVAV
ncbi:MAG TPA: glycosyltransferase, partial [Chloroflexota bacterium]|nr:glycosyltransferase [Chloroflexota bacterium]